MTAVRSRPSRPCARRCNCGRNSPRATTNSARALEHAGRTAEAIAEYKASVERDPALAESQYRLSLLYRKQGDIARADLAMAAFKKAQSAQGSDTALKKLEYRIGNQ